MQTDQHHKGPVQKAFKRSHTARKKSGHIITTDQKNLSEEGESRNNHRYAVRVQDLARQWIQRYPCKTQTSQETKRSLQKFLD